MKRSILNNFFVPFLQPIVGTLEKTPGKAWAILKPSILAVRAVVAEAFCLRHKQRCKVATAHCHVAGKCCHDHSDFGQQRGVQGKGAAVLLSCLGLRLLLQEAEVMQEHVKTFPPATRC